MMDLIVDFARAVFFAGLPVAAVTFAMIGWALRRNYLVAEADGRALEKGLADLKRRKKEDKRKLNPLHDKWLALGGGFYGIVGLITYAVIEWKDISRIVLDLGGLVGFIRNFHVGVIVEIFIESIKNFVTAVTWPLYWLTHSAVGNAWLWLVVAYGAYWLGLRAARRYAVVGQDAPAD